MKGLARGATLGYCTNVHPTTSAQEILRMIRTECLQVKERVNDQVDPSIHFGVGLWLSAARLREFQVPHLLEELKNECRNSGMNIFSWNAFPFLDFHQLTVKGRVYLPNWSEPSRLDYTLDLMDLIAKLDCGGKEVSISTLPIAGKTAALNEAQLELVVENLVAIILKAVKIEEMTGISIHLDLEPEPDCFLETSQDVVKFFEEYLLPRGSQKLKVLLGLSRVAAAQRILDKIRVCYDTCHAAVMHETPASVLENYRRMGIQIGKVQLSSGLVYQPDRGKLFQDSLAYRTLKELSLDRYLHQVLGKSATGSVEFYSDLNEALLTWGPGNAELDEYRIHYHVPIFMERLENLGTTQSHILELLQLAQTHEVTNHWEVETYTWSVLPPSYRPDLPGTGTDLPRLIAQEINWVHRKNQEALS